MALTQQQIADLILSHTPSGQYSLYHDPETDNWYFRKGQYGLVPKTPEEKEKYRKKMEADIKKKREAIPMLQKAIEEAEANLGNAKLKHEQIMEKRATVPNRSETWYFLNRMVDGSGGVLATAEALVKDAKQAIKSNEASIKNLEHQCSQLQ